MCREQSYARSLGREHWFAALEERYGMGVRWVYVDRVAMTNAQWEALLAEREAALAALPPLPSEPSTLHPPGQSGFRTESLLLPYYVLFFSAAFIIALPIYVFLLLPLEVAFRFWTASTRIALRFIYRGISLACSILLALIPICLIDRLLCEATESQDKALQPAETATKSQQPERRPHGRSSWRRSAGSSSSD